MKRLTLALTLCLTLCLALSPITAEARQNYGRSRVRYSSPRVRYSGRYHTRSHGGRYIGGRGSSHKGGHYRNFRTGNRYGRHK
jgi:hypothetical protein